MKTTEQDIEAALLELEYQTGEDGEPIIEQAISGVMEDVSFMPTEGVSNELYSFTPLRTMTAGD